MFRNSAEWERDSRKEEEIDIGNRPYMLASSSRAATNWNFDQRLERRKAFTMLCLRTEDCRKAIHMKRWLCEEEPLRLTPADITHKTANIFYSRTLSFRQFPLFSHGVSPRSSIRGRQTHQTSWSERSRLRAREFETEGEHAQNI